MMLVKKIIDIFNMQKEKIILKETFEYIELSYTSDQINLPTIDDIELIQEKISQRDRITINITCDGNKIAKYSVISDLEGFINDLSESLSDEDDVNYTVNMHIEKEVVDGNVTVYDSKTFINNFKLLTLKETLYNFNSIIREYGYIIFRTEENIKCNTRSIFFIDEMDQFNLVGNKREDNQIKRIANCSYLNSSECDLIADDFILINKSNNEKINKLFYKMSVVYALIGICDVSIINDNEITYVLNGYHRIENKFNYNDEFDEQLGEYIDIYNWIYNESSKSSCTDKIGIARNVISASIKENKLRLPVEGMYKSVCSAHSIYLKENVKEYLEVKSKISEFNFELMQKMSELSKEIGKSLLNNAIAICTFYGTVFIMNILSDKRLDNIFTRDITNLSLALCVFSFLYMFTTRYNISKDIRVFERQYNRIKHNYDDVLNSDDRDNIFKNDEYFDQDKKDIKKNVNYYTAIWVIYIIILLIFIYHLGYSHILELINGFKSLIEKQ